MAVIYRKYRPQTFAELVGQSHVQQILREQVIRGTVAHAYLFTGSRGVGKTTSARLLAKAVNCTGRAVDSGEPCGACEACIAITLGRAIDVMEIDAASHTGVDNIRETVIETARFAPTSLVRKVFIIDEVHMLSGGAWNALLKIIEEPPAHVLFILATTEAHKVPATIVSRCQRFDFRRVPTPLLVERLRMVAEAEKITVDDAVLIHVARTAEGCVRDAETLLGQLFALGFETIGLTETALVMPVSAMPRVVAFLTALIRGGLGEAIAMPQRLLDEGIDLVYFGKELLETARRLLFIASDASGVDDLDADTVRVLRELAREVTLAQLHWVLAVLTRRVAELKYAAVPPLALEMAAYEICAALERTHTDVRQPPSDSMREEAVVPVRSTADAHVLPHDVADGFLARVRLGWRDFIAKVAETNPSLPFVLQSAEPVGFAGNTLSIGVPYPFHRDKLNEEKTRRFLMDMIRKECGQEVHIEAVMLPPHDSLRVMDEVLDVFGGTVVG